MGAFTPGFTSVPSTQNSILPLAPGASTLAGNSATSSTSLPASTTPFGGFSYAGGGSLPGQNKIQATPTLDPALTNALLGYMGGQIGQGLPGFNQSVTLPSTGQQTAPGTLTAPLNPVLQQLEQFMTGQSGPGSLPGVMPMWQSEMAAMQQPIQQNLADLREQFGSMGALGSSEFATAGANYMSQTSADEMSLLTSATMSALPTMLSAGESLQGIDQSAINNAYSQFMTDLPQNNPLMGDLMSLATDTPGTYTKGPSELESALSGIGSSGLLTNVGQAIGSLPGLPAWASIALGA